MKIIFNALFYLLSVTTFAQSNDFLWAKQAGSSDFDSGRSITHDSFGNSYVTGGFSETVDFDPGVGVYNLTANGGLDIFILKLDPSGNFIWAKSFGGTAEDGGYSIAIDSLGNVCTLGYFYNTVDFDPGVGIYNLTSVGQYDFFISKLDAFGNFIWAKSIGGSSTDGGNSLTLDTHGNIYFTGDFSGTVDFDPGAGTYFLTSASGGYYDIYITKLNSNGNFVWAKRIGGNSDEAGYSIDIDANDNVITTGFFLSSTVDFDPGVGITNLSNTGSADIFIVKLDTAGNFIWAKVMGGANEDYSNSITHDAFGNIYTTGFFIGTTDFDPGAGIYNLTSTALLGDVFISKLDSSGNIIWAKSMTGNDLGNAKSIILDASANIYTTGLFSGTVDFDPGPGVYNQVSGGDFDIFISKLDSSGNFIFAIRIGGGVIDSIYANSIDIDGSGSIYTTGSFRGTVDFDPGIGVYNQTSAGWQDIFILKLGINCTLQATIQSTGNLNLCSGDSVTLAANTGDGLLYQWQLSGADINGATNSTYTTSTAGDYSINISDTSGCSASSSTTIITVTPLPSVTVNPITICIGLSGTLGATGAISYTWSPSTGLSATTGSTVTANPTITTTYTVVGSNSASCSDTATAVVTVLPSPTANAGADAEVCSGGSVQLQANGGAQYEWSPTTGLSDANIDNPVADPSATTIYTVLVTDASGCTASDEIKVTKKDVLCFFLPTVFTPNDDGTNDTWEIPGLNSYPNCSVSVFNRWGQLLFSSVGYSQPWDGTYIGNKLPVADYYYIIDLKDGTPAFTGTLTIKL